MSNKAILDYQLGLDDEDRSRFWLPDVGAVCAWIDASLKEIKSASPVELTVRVVGSQEITELNQTYRSKNTATNVLSFPCDYLDELDVPLLGDIVICAKVVNDEALEQNKPIENHWAHMVVHGCLHLFGFDHQSDEQASEMETLEIAILNNLGFNNPYDEFLLERGLGNVSL